MKTATFRGRSTCPRYQNVVGIPQRVPERHRENVGRSIVRAPIPTEGLARLVGATKNDRVTPRFVVDDVAASGLQWCCAKEIGWTIVPCRAHGLRTLATRSGRPCVECQPPKQTLSPTLIVDHPVVRQRLTSGAVQRRPGGEVPLQERLLG